MQVLLLLLYVFDPENRRINVCGQFTSLDVVPNRSIRFTVCDLHLKKQGARLRSRT